MKQYTKKFNIIYIFFTNEWRFLPHQRELTKYQPVGLLFMAVDNLYSYLNVVWSKNQPTTDSKGNVYDSSTYQKLQHRRKSFLYCQHQDLKKGTLLFTALAH